MSAGTVGRMAMGSAMG